MEDNKAPQAAPEAVPAQTEAPKAAQPAKDPATDARFAHLARKERQLRAQARDVEAKRKEWEEMSKPKPATMEDFKAKLLEDPTSLGLNYDQLAQLVLNQGNPQDQAFKQLQREIQALKSELETGKKAQSESQDQAYKNALKQIDRDVRMLIDSDKEFETIKTAGQQEAVTGLIEQTFKEDGYLMGVAEAAQVIEEQLLEHAVSLAKLEKVKAKLTPTQAAAAQAEAAEAPSGSPVAPQNEIQALIQKQAQEAKKRSVTITNRLSAESSNPKRTSEQERVARAIAAALNKP